MFSIEFSIFIINSCIRKTNKIIEADIAQGDQKLVYSIIATLKIKKGKLDEAVEILKNFSEWVKANERGTVYYLVHKLKDQSVLVVYEQYKNEAAFNIHCQHLMERAKELLTLVEGNIEVQNLEDI